ncbi:MAG TPA: MG2 domain-containing protein, partial [Pirellulales bacterium]|nr:MG2 domain-containing protein [Pirellulales bacterium]
MNKSRNLVVSLVGLGLLSALALVAWSAAPEAAPTQQDRDAASKKMTNGNFKDAYDEFRRMALDKKDEPRKAGEDLKNAIVCLERLGRADEIDDFREKAIDVHKENWRLLWAAADSYLYVEHNGFLIAGKFSRGYHRGGGQWANAFAHDRVRALQLMQQTFPLVDADNDDGAAKADFYFDLATMLVNGRNYNEAWRLQVLTDIAKVPDYSEIWNNGGGATRGAPVDDAGNPIYYSAVKRWKDAANDGQRWRWALAEAVEMSHDKLNEARIEFADFLHSQFGVQTMAQYGSFGRGGEDASSDKDRTGPFAVHSLGEAETIARLANGIKRFKLPDEFNFIKIYQTIADNPKTGQGEAALGALAQIFENRQQYPKAADYWRRSIKEYGPGPNNYKQQQLDQIVGNWGRFDSGVVQPAGHGASVQFTFRNGKHVSFEAHAIKIEKLLDDVKTYLKSRPSPPDWQKFNLQDIGYRLVTQNQEQYVGPKIASWELDLDPPAEHFNRQFTVATPLQKAGAYLLSAKMADGNTCRIIVWLADTALVQKNLNNGVLYVVADAVTGKPIPKMNVELFGYRQRFEQPNHWALDTKNLAEFSNADGEVILDQQRAPADFNWIAIARGDGDRLAYVGFSNVWYGNQYDYAYNQIKVFTITDRPVYRPGQQVKFKFWIEHAQYDKEGKSDFANQNFKVELHDPKGSKLLEKTFKSDSYGGIKGEYELSSTATLGMYQLYVVNRGGGNFRVEEYKKPEFEVSVDAPTEPVMLGEKIKATIKAKYYFGSPVVNAKVKYKIVRSNYAETWFPPGRWDWLYGPGYWWFGYNYEWFPGWSDWGCRRPIPWWWGASYQPPEVVADAEAPIGPDGTLSVDIDTALAKAVHPDQDQRYEITAEVVDATRRTIVGAGTVLVARKPFKVTAWLERGYYHTGDEIVAHVAGRTLDGKPVKGTGHLVLYKVSYPEPVKAGKEAPVEKAVEEWNIDTDAEGMARQTMKAAAPGQYRLSYKLSDAKGHTIEGGYVFTITGPDFTGASYRFNDLELIPDKRDYAPGETVKLMVNTNRTDAFVWLFLRPANGVYLPPKLLRLDGKSTIFEIGVTKHDMPNFFVEALTISGGKAFNELKDIVVPPEQRILNIAVKPSKTDYRPGDKAKVGITLTDLAGKAFVGSTVVAIYDKAVEYISGGSNVADIKAYFWQWRRSHNLRQETNLDLVFHNLLRQGETGMSDLGAFGYMTGRMYSRHGAAAGDWGGENRRQSLRGLGGEQLEKDAAFGADAAAAAPMALAAGNANMAMDGLQARAKGENGDRAAEGDKRAPGVGGGGGQPAMIQPSIRSNFADTALWVGALETNDKGEAEVALTMPENLTTWKVKVWAMGQGTKVG